MKTTSIPALILLIAVASFATWGMHSESQKVIYDSHESSIQVAQQYVKWLEQNDRSLPQQRSVIDQILTDVMTESTSAAEITIDSQTQQETQVETVTTATSAAPRSARPVTTTRGVQHSIPMNEIAAGGPPKDGIPSIDNPKFESFKDARKWLDDDEPGIGIEVAGQARFYPYDILVRHELVNDMIAGIPVLVSYCSLCRTGIVFERTVNGEVLEFGVSGKLWESNVLMYDRRQDPDNESYWSQVLAQAVVGPATGTLLTIVPSSITTLGAWEQAHLDSEVLSRDTGIYGNLTYSRDPYGGYYENTDIWFGSAFTDQRLHPKALVLGVEIDGAFRAYTKDAIEVGETVDETWNDLVIQRDAFDRVVFMRNGIEVPHIEGFWFSWIGAHPGTTLWNG